MAMFDTSVSSQTSKTGGIDVTVTPGETVDTLALLNVNASTHPRARDRPTDGVVYDQTTNMIAPISDSSWYMWFRADCAQGFSGCHASAVWLCRCPGGA